MKVLFIGGGGFIGKTIIEKMVLNHECIVYDSNGDDSFTGFDTDKLKIYKGNMEEHENMYNVIERERPECIVHLVCNILPGSREDEVLKYMDLNMNSTLKLFEYMREFSIKKLVYISSGGAIYGDNGKSINKEDDELKPINFYGWIKYAIEKYIKAYHKLYGFEYLIVRPSNPFGKYQNIFGRQGIVAVAMGKVLKNEIIEIWGDGEVVRDYISAEEMGEVFAEVFEKGSWNEIYNIGSGVGKSINEILGMIRKVSKRNMKIEYVAARKADVQMNVLDVSKCELAIGRKIRFDFENDIKNMWKEVLKRQEGIL